MREFRTGAARSTARRSQGHSRKRGQVDALSSALDRFSRSRELFWLTGFYFVKLNSFVNSLTVVCLLCTTWHCSEHSPSNYRNQNCDNGIEDVEETEQRVGCRRDPQSSCHIGTTAVPGNKRGCNCRGITNHS